MSSAVDCPCPSSEDMYLISKLSKDVIHISMTNIRRISACTSAKTPENSQERTLIKAKDYGEEFQVLF